MILQQSDFFNEYHAKMPQCKKLIKTQKTKFSLILIYLFCIKNSKFFCVLKMIGSLQFLSNTRELLFLKNELENTIPNINQFYNFSI